MFSMFGNDPFEEMSLWPVMVPRYGHGHGQRARRPGYGIVQKKDGDKTQFCVKMDVQQFAPEEIEVKIKDNHVIVEGKHEERADEHGYIKRHFVRRYQIPDNVKPEALSCNLSSDGVLEVTAPLMLEDDKPGEKSIPIMQTGRPALTQASDKMANTSGDTPKHD